MPTLAELRAQSSAPVPLPKASRTVTLVEGQHLLARTHELEEEYLDLKMQADRDREAADLDQQAAAKDGRDRTRKQGQRPTPSDDAENPRYAEIKAESRALAEQLAEFQAQLDLEGMTGGEWQRYKDERPARADNRDDLSITRGLCNFSDVFTDLARFVKAWEGEEVKPGDWDGWLAERICYADRRDLVSEVVEMHEARLPRSPKSPSGASVTAISETA